MSAAEVSENNQISRIRKRTGESLSNVIKLET